MSGPHYVFPTWAEAQACADDIASDPRFPITPLRNGQPDYDAQKTLRWADPIELVSGEWAVPVIPEERLDTGGPPFKNGGSWVYPGVPPARRITLLAPYKSTQRELKEGDILYADPDS